MRRSITGGILNFSLIIGISMVLGAAISIAMRSNRVQAVESAKLSKVIPYTSVGIIDSNLSVDFSKLNIQLSDRPNVITIEIPQEMDTNSMYPMIDVGTVVTLISGNNIQDQKSILDWVHNEFNIGNKSVVVGGQLDYIHRVYKIWIDNGVRKWILKGDNNLIQDADTLVDDDIKWLYVGSFQ